MTTPDSPPTHRPCGAITLVRHGEPALSRRVKLSSSGYAQWWATYEEGGLLEGQIPPETLIETVQNATRRFASTRRRAQETARAVCGDLSFDSDDIFIEAPLPPPPLPEGCKCSPSTWGILARFCWWFFNMHGGQESRAQATLRADAAAAKLEALALEGETVVLLAHGFFNRMIGRALQKRGWRLTRDGSFYYWSARRFERRS